MVMSVRALLFFVCGAIIFVASPNGLSSSGGHMDVDTDCAICLVATSAEDVCVCQGVRANKKGRDSCSSLFSLCEETAKQDLERVLVGDEVIDQQGHYFHQGCLRQWIVRGGSCPVCQKNFSLEDRINLWKKVVFSISSLTQGAATGNLNRVKKYLRQGLPINLCDVVGFAPLHYAARYGYMDVVQELLRCPGVIVDINDICGNTPLYWAIYGGYKDITKMLLTAGAVLTQKEINIAYTQGHFLLYWSLIMI